MTVGADRLMQISAAPRSTSRCRECRQPIEWAVQAGTPAKYVALDPNPLVLGYARNAGGVMLLRISINNRHSATCRRQRARAQRSRTFRGQVGYR